jgi:hypothetical protein
LVFIEYVIGKTEAMNTNNIQNSPQGLAHPFSKTDTTNAHAPVGYELVAFVFDLLFNVVVLGATKTFGSVSQKYSLMQRYYFSLKHPNISLFYFPIGN